jgi:hypothetical protein
LGSAAKRRRSEAQRTEQRRVFIAKHDGVCHLCRTLVGPETLPPTHPMSATRDHVLPRPHRRKGENVEIRLAHRLCNQLRGNAPIYAVLAPEVYRLALDEAMLRLQG